MLTDLEELVAWIAETHQLDRHGVRRALELLQEGNTLPFIARYRKEATRGLTEVQLRQVEDSWISENELQARKNTILKIAKTAGGADRVATRTDWKLSFQKNTRRNLPAFQTKTTHQGDNRFRGRVGPVG